MFRPLSLPRAVDVPEVLRLMSSELRPRREFSMDELAFFASVLLSL
jgi:hypothetical protein